MEEIYANIGCDKSVNLKASQYQRGPQSSERRFHAAVVLFLGLLSVFLLAGLIGLGVHYHDSIQRSAAQLSTITTNLTECLQASNNFSSLIEERDLLNASLTEMTQELERLQSLVKQTKTCPAGWRMFSHACYFLSNEPGSWDKGREDCRDRGADLVVVNSHEEEIFLTALTKKNVWIGLSDRDEEGTWKWVDGSPLTLTYWPAAQPDNGGGDPQWGEEDCVHIRTEMDTHWNDLSCEASLQWICEKIA
ncbi:CD209 antigen-like protein C [Chaetodon auriga]|uniref:CD209 antigen-like protein C n=1 Tax=Chaetodon auriga TaxID=39042 RepID=UPI0040329D5C